MARYFRADGRCVQRTAVSQSSASLVASMSAGMSLRCRATATSSMRSPISTGRRSIALRPASSLRALATRVSTASYPRAWNISSAAHMVSSAVTPNHSGGTRSSTLTSASRSTDRISGPPRATTSRPTSGQSSAAAACASALTGASWLRYHSTAR